MTRPVTLASLGEIMCPYCGAMDLRVEGASVLRGGATIGLRCDDCSRDDFALMLLPSARTLVLAWWTP